MRTKLTKIALAASLVLALAFTLSCSSDDGGGGNGNSSGSTGGTGGKTKAAAITLTADTWTNGNIPTEDGQQWFKFTATASPQYIHRHGVYAELYLISIWLYDSSDNLIESNSLLNPFEFLEASVTVGEVYYIKVVPRDGSGFTGQHKITLSSIWNI